MADREWGFFLFVISVFRQSSQKPSDELFERFRQSFPGVRVGSTSGPSESQLQTAGGLQDSTLNQPRQVSAS